MVVGEEMSSVMACRWGVPQGSVLGPVLFALYTSPIASVVKLRDAQHGAYAVDVNIYSSVSPSGVNDCAAVTAATDLNEWYIRNGLLPNPEKSEAVLVGTIPQLSRFTRPLHFEIGGATVVCADTIKTLGVIIDSGLTSNQRVDSIVSACNYHLRALNHVRRALTAETAITVGRAIVLSRLDYCNSLLAGTSQANFDRLQRLQN